MQEKNIKFLKKSNIELNFTDKKITSYGGFSLLAKLFEKIELKESLIRKFENFRKVNSLKFSKSVLYVSRPRFSYPMFSVVLEVFFEKSGDL